MDTQSKMLVMYRQYKDKVMQYEFYKYPSASANAQ